MVAVSPTAIKQDVDVHEFEVCARSSVMLQVQYGLHSERHASLLICLLCLLIINVVF